MGLAHTTATADEHGLATIADLARYVNACEEFKLAASQEFVDREDALPAFESTYGFAVTDDQLVILAGGNTTQTETAAARGTDGVNCSEQSDPGAAGRVACGAAGRAHRLRVGPPCGPRS